MSGRNIVETIVDATVPSPPTPIPMSDPSMTDWPLFTAVCLGVFCLVVLLLALCTALLSSPDKPKPKVVKKE
jgi:hypothetical protein